MTGHRCTCTLGVPEVVDFGGIGNDGETTVHSSDVLLLRNLQQFGWCPIRIPTEQIGHPPPTQQKILQMFRDYRRKNNSGQHIDQSCTSFVDDVKYVSSESGSKEGTVEPKESLEIELSSCIPTDTKTSTFPLPLPAQYHQEPSHDNNNASIKTWCQAMSWIAHQVCIRLDIPPNTFLSYHSTNTSSSSSSSSSSLDLMRVFHYYAVSVPSINDDDNDTEQLILGSSPHTDWGSLTIVWQDHVGGLQTYCRNCQSWIPVPPPSCDTASEHTWNVIVHVGDMASLVLDASQITSSFRSTESDGARSDCCLEPIANDSNLDCSVKSEISCSSSSWPSPKHRVVSSPLHERVSLVYFAYPPSNATLNGIHSTLHNWQPRHRTSCLPLDEYYLLQDQSSHSDIINNKNNNNNKTLTAAEMLTAIWNLPIQDIVRLKWKQVYRGSNDVGKNSKNNSSEEGENDDSGNDSSLTG
ncbi:2(OG)-Fe(II) oxygenase superfamily protein [Nitzschia inconspicua]|uniref:2(OG)-Fe(II) oxygenase superfamily protein n=1 Tax=Nitzschia inconspicua TaxID=303405 RepID=A0A9K3PS30_9STRA|nr:2(OG)-Fe(II) oxygenase superfamily protein [Nitzschia inconspicua]